MKSDPVVTRVVDRSMMTEEGEIERLVALCFIRLITNNLLWLWQRRLIYEHLLKHRWQQKVASAASVFEEFQPHFQRE